TANLGDLDGDGDLDVVVCPSSETALDPCAAFLNDGYAHFTLAPASDLENAAGVFQCASAALFDYDRDGRIDFWPGTFGTAPLLLQGGGDGNFHYVSDLVGLPTLSGDPATGKSFPQIFGVTACDLDGDGDQD